MLTHIISYPHKIIALQHAAKCSLPVPIAFCLTKCPQLVSAAVEAFYYRDMDTMKVCFLLSSHSPLQHCTQMNQFSPSKRVMCTVHFTRFLYAMLVKQRFEPPKVFGKPFVPPTHPDAKAYDLGVKIVPTSPYGLSD